MLNQASAFQTADKGHLVSLNLLEERDENTSPLVDEIENFIGRCIYKGTSLIGFTLRLLSEIARDKEISQGFFFITEEKENKQDQQNIHHASLSGRTDRDGRSL